MKQTETLDRIIDAAGSRLESEIQGLLATDFILDAVGNGITDRSGAFSELKGKQVCTRVDLAGEVSGSGCFLVGIKDAIRLAGTLIMLPATELEEAIGREEYSEEIEDAYGEIGNIIAAAFSSDFEEMYSAPCVLMRKEQEVISPGEVDIAASQPVEDQPCYQATFAMTLDGKPMGNLVLLLPAAAFDLVESPAEKTGPEAARAQKIAKLTPEKKRRLVEGILEESREKLETEVGALMGIEVMLADPEYRLADKEQFFTEIVQSRQVLADLEVSGDSRDTSYFSIGVKDAVFLGGTLIMLPPSELEVVVGKGEFGEDARDAYGEIANIIAGVYNAAFEDHHVYKLRFVRKGVREVVPAKVDIESDEPFADRSYFIGSMSLVANGKSLGKVHMLIPAEVLQLQEDLPQPAEEQVEQPGDDQNEAAAREEEVTPAAVETAGQESGKSRVDVEKNRQKVDRVLAQCQDTVVEEVGALLGVEVSFSDLRNQLVSKEDFFAEETLGEQVIVDFNILGDKEGQGYLFLDTGDAIRIGGVLIMLPESELETAVAEKNFSVDLIDAYGEIANIISGAYTTVFAENFNKKIRFVKAGLGQVSPVKVDPESDEPMPDGSYYLSSMNILVDGRPLGRMKMLLPLDLLQLEGLAAPEKDAADETVQEVRDTGAAAQRVSGTQQETGGEGPHGGSTVPDILLVSDDNAEADKIVTVLREAGYSVKSISTRDNIQNYIPGRLKAVYLVVREVNEQAFGMAIQVSSSSGLPIIAAGPGWTRSKVIKAVKYGVQDILLTPATREDIEENIANNLLKLAA